MASAYYNTDSEDEIQSPNNSVMDLNSSAQEIYDNLMKEILMIPHERKPTMPIERQQTIKFNQPTVSTKTWADMTDDELSSDEMIEAQLLDTIFHIQANPIQVTTSPVPSEESGSAEMVGPPAKSPRQDPILSMFSNKLSIHHQSRKGMWDNEPFVRKFKNSAGRKAPGTNNSNFNHNYPQHHQYYQSTSQNQSSLTR